MRDEGKERRATCSHSPNSLKTGQEAVGTSDGLEIPGHVMRFTCCYSPGHISDVIVRCKA